MTSNECNSTLDCLQVGSGVPRVCYEVVEFSDREFFCDCSNWYGWTGESCDQPTFLTYYSLCSLVFIALWSITVMVLSARTLSFHIAYRRVKKKLNPVFYIALLIFLGSGCLLAYTFINIPAQIDSTRFDLFSYRDLSPGEIHDVAAKGGRIGTYCFIMLGNLYLLISAQIIISWYDVIAKTAKMFPLMYNFSPKTIISFLKSWMLLYGFISLLLLFLDFNSGAKITLIICALLAAVGYCVGGVHIVQALDHLRQETNNVAWDATNLIIRAYRVNSLLLVLQVVLMTLNVALYLVVDGSLKPGSFNPLIIVRDLIGLVGLAMMTFNSWYVHQITTNVLRLDKTQSWLPRLSPPQLPGIRSSRRQSKTEISLVEENVDNEKSFESLVEHLTAHSD